MPQVKKSQSIQKSRTKLSKKQVSHQKHSKPTSPVLHATVEKMKIEGNTSKKENKLEKTGLNTIEKFRGMKLYLLYIFPVVFECLNYIHCTRVQCSLYFPGLSLIVILFPTLLINIVFSYTHKYKKYQNLIHKRDHHTTEAAIYLVEIVTTLISQLLFIGLILWPYVNKYAYIYVGLSIVLWLIVYIHFTRQMKFYDKLKS
jgi:hypothetical protein